MSKQQLFPHDVVRKLKENGKLTQRAQNLGLPEPDFLPVVRIFNPFGASTWILTELDADNDTLFGLCDLGAGFPELGYVSRAELEAVPLERDEDWMTDYPLTVWLEAAQRDGRIVDDERALAQAAAKLEREPRWRERHDEEQRV